MTYDDRTHLALLDGMRAAEPAGTVAEVSDVTAADQRNAIELTVDDTRRVLAVKVLDLPALRSVPAFTSALIGAFQTADGERAMLALDQNGALDGFLDRVEREFAERPGLDVPPKVDVSYAAYTSGRLHHDEVRAADQARPVNPPARTSDNGYLTVQRDGAGDVLTVEVDEEWLLGARTEHLEAAIKQAMTITWDGE